MVTFKYGSNFERHIFIGDLVPQNKWIPFINYQKGHSQLGKENKERVVGHD